ncbi:MAG: bifunctional adenosylcobinamide kinase/adenosylcobinamide-phosphate guanylyltransferase [Actinomycetota bacterium]|jgi:adenosylcobinamide kinase/adenosylcobinamide-phosphate guanylyltransferase
MKVVVLGTGAADGWPSPFCECLSCADMRLRGHVRTPTAALVDDVILIDAGPTVPSAAARAGASLRHVRHVLVTHGHPDHLDPALLLWLDWNPTPHTVHLWGPPAVVRACRDWIGPRTPIELHEVSPGDALTLPTPSGDIRVRVIAARHEGRTPDEVAAEAVIYDVRSADGGRLLYATDTGLIDDLEPIRDAAYDVILIEETFGDHLDHGTGHLDLATLPIMLERLEHVGARTESTQVIAVHLGHHNPPEALLRDRLASFGVRLVDEGAVLGVPRRELILGGARSGKSREAERRALQYADVMYVATAAPRPGDADWAARVDAHRARRPAHWRTVEGPGALIPALRDARAGSAVLVDCLTLWLTGVLDAASPDWEDTAALAGGAQAATKELIDALTACRADVILVSNEVGMGVVPATRAGRLFADLLGRAHQDIAGACDRVTLMVAGRGMEIGDRRG